MMLTKLLYDIEFKGLSSKDAMSKNSISKSTFYRAKRLFNFIENIINDTNFDTNYDTPKIALKTAIDKVLSEMKTRQNDTTYDTNFGTHEIYTIIIFYYNIYIINLYLTKTSILNKLNINNNITKTSILTKLINISQELTKTNISTKLKGEYEGETDENDVEKFMQSDEWKEWMSFRSKLKIKKYAYPERAVKNLLKLANGDFETAKKIIEQSINMNYQGLFALKGNYETKRNDKLSEIRESANKPEFTDFVEQIRRQVK